MILRKIDRAHPLSLSFIMARLPDRDAKYHKFQTSGWERLHVAEFGYLYWRMWVVKDKRKWQYNLIVSYEELRSHGVRFVAQRLCHVRRKLKEASRLSYRSQYGEE